MRDTVRDAPQTYILLTFDSVVIGIAVQFGVQNLMQETSALTIISASAFFLTSLNFFHAKLNLLLDRSYQDYLSVRPPAAALADFGFHVLTVGSFAFMPFLLTMTTAYAINHIAVRSFDTGLVSTILITSQRLKPSSSRWQRVVHTHTYWLIINAAVVAIVLISVMAYRFGVASSIVVASVILAISVLDVMLDYAVNWHWYFGKF